MARRPVCLPNRWGLGRRDRRPKGNDSGAAAVELAAVVLWFLVLVFGIINYGFIFASQISMSAAARDAARAGVVMSNGIAMECGAIAEMASDSLVILGGSPTAVLVTVSGGGGICTWQPPAITGDDPETTGDETAEPCTGSNGGPLTVAIQYSYESIVPFPPPTSAELKADGVFRCEYT